MEYFFGVTDPTLYLSLLWLMQNLEFHVEVYSRD